MARGLGPSGLARAPHERGGQNKGDFSHLGDSPPLPAVPITGIEYKDRIQGRKEIYSGTVLRAERNETRKRYIYRPTCGTVLPAERNGTRKAGEYIYRSSCGAVLRAEQNGTRKAGEYI